MASTSACISVSTYSTVTPEKNAERKLHQRISGATKFRIGPMRQGKPRHRTHQDVMATPIGLGYGWVRVRVR